MDGSKVHRQCGTRRLYFNFDSEITLMAETTKTTKKTKKTTKKATKKTEMRKGDEEETTDACSDRRSDIILKNDRYIADQRSAGRRLTRR